MNEISKKAKEFAAYWSKIDESASEKKNSQKFWISLLSEVYGVKDIKTYIEFEDEVKLDNTSYIDGYIPTTRVLIEQKSKGKNLKAAIKQSDGSFLTPFQQAKRYNSERPFSKQARWIITCNFSEFYIYDMEQPTGEPIILLLEDLPNKYEMLNILIDTKKEEIINEVAISKEAGDLIGKLYDAILEKYNDKRSDETLKSLNVLAVRLVFLYYAEDSDLLQSKTAFTDYIKNVDAVDIREKLIALFKVLNTKEDVRDKYLSPTLAGFPYVNGGLFEDENIEIPLFDENIKEIMVKQCGEGFDWSNISPTIFGAMFESTLNPEVRRKSGMHYTSIENIHKVIDPLFLNDLNDEYNEIENMTKSVDKVRKAESFINKISNLSFLDPACGSGNFLTETYMCLRRLENKCLRIIRESDKRSMQGERMFLRCDDTIKIKLDNFFGIEINDFATTVAKTAMWIAEHQMLRETEEVLYLNISDYLPLRHFAHIAHGNALRMDWDAVVNGDVLNYYSLSHEEKPLDKLLENKKQYDKKVDYIMGNPPFVGAMYMDEKQKRDMQYVFSDIKGNGEFDFVTAWYKKTCEYMQAEKKKIIESDILDTKIAFVSTNSICQGQSVITFWKYLYDVYDIDIDFAYQTFVWNSESNEKAKVHCVIVGFSKKKNNTKKIIYTYNDIKIQVDNINPYLNKAKTIFIEEISNPICEIPKIRFGSMPRDGGGFVITEEEKTNVIKKEPNIEKYIKLYLGAEEFLNNKKRYCLWLVDAKPTDINNSSFIKDRVKKVKEFRLASKAAGTRKFADTPTLFCQIAQPDSEYLIVPKTSSSIRRYLPIGFANKSIIASDLLFLIPNATLYDFSILMSNIHNAWMRTVAGRLKSDYRYSKDIVYNNFPWPIDITKDNNLITDKEKLLLKKNYPSVDADMKEKLELCAKNILDARKLYPDSSLADLYHPDSMPKELLKAHQQNDIMVIKAYGFSKDEYRSEEACVARLFDLYNMLISV